ncbi:MAG TPA: dihydroxy-acid dehydratase, partial [Streptosporangiaceae bacterium]|nr:dihydroxy-acid dehydratase [Streptosporangiaceae bacterium]
TLVNLMPSGQYLMEDFCYAGGVPAVMRELGDLLHTGHVSVTGRTLADNIAGAQCWDPDVIRPLGEPVQPPGSGTAVLRGNLCPDGAVIKQSAASPQLLKHRGQALVFDSIEAYHEVCADPGLPVTESTVLVVRGAGPKGYPGMPEIGNFVLPRKMLEHGVTDMVRISDARMSGTGFGTVILHVAPEAAVGGPLALVRSGDWIELDVPGRTLSLDVSDDELARRREAWLPPRPLHGRGYARLYVEHVQQADKGADLDFLVGGSGAAVPRDNH